MDVAGALALDYGGVVVGDAQRHLGAELARQIGGERRIAIDDARGVLGRRHRVHQFRILRLPGLRQRDRADGGAGQAGKQGAATDHGLVPMVAGETEGQARAGSAAAKMGAGAGSMPAASRASSP